MYFEPRHSCRRATLSTVAMTEALLTTARVGYLEIEGTWSAMVTLQALDVGLAATLTGCLSAALIFRASLGTVALPAYKQVAPCHDFSFCVSKICKPTNSNLHNYSIQFNSIQFSFIFRHTYTLAMHNTEVQRKKDSKKTNSNSIHARKCT